MLAITGKAYPNGNCHSPVTRFMEICLTLSFWAKRRIPFIRRSG